MTIASLTRDTISAMETEACKFANLSCMGKRNNILATQRTTLILGVLQNLSVTDKEMYAIDCYLKQKKYLR